MAERRMMAKKVINSDAFMDMPISTQNLYFYLLLEGDDDGFVNNPKRIQRMIGANDDDAKLLLAKKFILSFESGVIVIKHWKMHNYIQKDRYKPTSHIEEKSQLTLRDNNVYTMDTECIQDVRVGKVREGESNNAPQIENLDDVNIDYFETIWKEYTLGYLKKQNRRGGKKHTARERFFKLIGKYTIQDIKALVVNEYKLKLGSRDLERVFTMESMKQFMEDRSAA